MGPSWDGVAGPAATAGVVVAVAEVVSVELLDVGELLELVDDSADVVEVSDEVVDDEGDVVRVLLDDVVLSSEDSFSDQSSSLSPLLLSSPNRRRRKSVNGLLAGTEDSEAIGAAMAPGAVDEVVSDVDVASEVDVTLLSEVREVDEVPDVPVVDDVVRLLDVLSS